MGRRYSREEGAAKRRRANELFRQGYSREEVAQELGVTVRSLSRWVAEGSVIRKIEDSLIKMGAKILAKNILDVLRERERASNANPPD